MMRHGVVTKVMSGDMLIVDNGYTTVRICNVWADQAPPEIADELRKVTEEMLLGKEIQYNPTGHIHFDNVSIVSEVYLGSTWVNQVLRYWLTTKLPHYAPVVKEQGSSAT